MTLGSHEGGSNPGASPDALTSSEQRVASGAEPDVTEEHGRSTALRGGTLLEIEEIPASAEVLSAQTAIAEGPVHSAASIYLGSFLGSEPDISGWNGHLNQLAAIAELDSGSVREDLSRNRIEGRFVVPGAGTRIDFTISDEGYSIDSKDTILLSAFDETPFSYHASLAFQHEEGTIRESHGIVQFMPQDGQDYFEQGPVGYIYGMTDRETAYRPVRGQIRDGDYCVVVPPKGSNQVTQYGDLGTAYHWMSRLQEVERSVARQRASSRAR